MAAFFCATGFFIRFDGFVENKLVKSHNLRPAPAPLYVNLFKFAHFH